jgi:integrase
MRNDFKRHLDHATCNTSPTGKLQKLRDGGGLYLYIEPSGARGWRFYYQRPITKKQNTISFGPFPAISLSEARDKCDAARKLVAHGIDPSTNKQEVARAAVVQSAGAVTFRGFTNFETPNAAGEIEVGAWWQFAMIDEKSRVSGEAKSFETVRRVQIDLRTLQEALGDRPVKEIKSGEILAVLDRLSKKGNLNKAHRVQQMATRIFNLAVARQVCDYNVAAPCKDAIAKHLKKKMPAITDHILDIGLQATEAKVGELMRRIRDYRGRHMTRKALEMMALTFPRPANIASMEWSEIDFAINAWIIPADKMKMSRVHKVQLSRQALAILEEMRPLTGNGKRVFPLTKNCLTRALAKMGYDTETEQSTHGFRSIASTLLNESEEWSADAIELQMAHKVGGRADRGAGVRGTYNQAERMEERRAMLQWWADYLDRLRDGNVVTLAKAA